MNIFNYAVEAAKCYGLEIAVSQLGAVEQVSALQESRIRKAILQTELSPDENKLAIELENIYVESNSRLAKIRTKQLAKQNAEFKKQMEEWEKQKEEYDGLGFLHFERSAPAPTFEKQMEEWEKQREENDGLGVLRFEPSEWLGAPAPTVSNSPDLEKYFGDMQRKIEADRKEDGKIINEAVNVQFEMIRKYSKQEIHATLENTPIVNLFNQVQKSHPEEIESNFHTFDLDHTKNLTNPGYFEDQLPESIKSLITCGDLNKKDLIAFVGPGPAAPPPNKLLADGYTSIPIRSRIYLYPSGDIDKLFSFLTSILED